MFKTQFVTEKNIEYIKEELIKSGADKSWVNTGDYSKSWVTKDNKSGKYIIIAFFCFKKDAEYLLLEHFWIHPEYRKKGRVFNIIAGIAVDKAKMLGHDNFFANVDIEDVEIIEKMCGHPPFKKYDRGAYFLITPSILKMFRKIKR